MARQLNKRVQEFQEGKHEGSVLTVATVESLSMDEKQTWRAIQKELEDIGISVAAFDANRGFIMNWFHDALETGKFEEQNRERLDDEPQQELPDRLMKVASRTSLIIEDSDDYFRGQDYPTRMITQEREKGSNINQPPASKSIPAPSKPSVISIEPDLQYKKGPGIRGRPPKVALLVAWMLRYDKAFYTACRSSNLDEARRLLDKGANINSISYDHTPLTFAVSHKMIGLQDFLLAAGADIESVNGFGRTPLHEVIYHCNFRAPTDDYYLATMKYLLNHGAMVDGLDGYYHTPLQEALSIGDANIVALLFEHGAKIPFRDQHNIQKIPFHLPPGGATL